MSPAEARKIRILVAVTLAILTAVTVIPGFLVVFRVAIASDSVGAPKSFPSDFPQALREDPENRGFRRFYSPVNSDDDFQASRFYFRSSSQGEAETRRYLAPAGFEFRDVVVNKIEKLSKQPIEGLSADLPKAYIIQIGSHEFQAPAPESPVKRVVGGMRTRSGGVVTETYVEGTPDRYEFVYTAPQIVIPWDAVGTELAFSVYAASDEPPKHPDKIYVVTPEHYSLWSAQEIKETPGSLLCLGAGFVILGTLFGVAARLAWRGLF
jgi:hypothetical protein